MQTNALFSNCYQYFTGCGRRENVAGGEFKYPLAYARGSVRTVPIRLSQIWIAATGRTVVKGELWLKDL
jgi:hypothetical protein